MQRVDSIIRNDMAMRRRRQAHLNLAVQHAECEMNYARLLKILPDMASCDRRFIGLAGAADQQRRLQFSVIERSRYTTTLEIAEFGARSEWGLSAEFSVRAYHDARMAEVMAFQRQRNIAVRNDYPNPRMHMPDEKQQWNSLLSEWLTHCLAHGHALDAAPLHFQPSLQRGV